MYPAYFDGKIHEINRNLAGLLLIVALSIDLAGVLNTVTVGRIKCYRVDSGQARHLSFASCTHV